MRTWLCVSKVQAEWDYAHANWLLIEAETRGKAKAEYVRRDGDTEFKDVKAVVHRPEI